MNPGKCAFATEETKYLGYIVGRGLVQPQINKVEFIQAWPCPVTKKQVKAFFCIVGYYSKFVPNVSYGEIK